MVAWQHFRHREPGRSLHMRDSLHLRSQSHQTRVFDADFARCGTGVEGNPIRGGKQVGTWISQDAKPMPKASRSRRKGGRRPVRSSSASPFCAIPIAKLRKGPGECGSGGGIDRLKSAAGLRRNKCAVDVKLGRLYFRSPVSGYLVPSSIQEPVIQVGIPPVLTNGFVI